MERRAVENRRRDLARADDLAAVGVGDDGGIRVRPERVGGDVPGAVGVVLGDDQHVVVDEQREGRPVDAEHGRLVAGALVGDHDPCAVLLLGEREDGAVVRDAAVRHDDRTRGGGRARRLIGARGGVRRASACRALDDAEDGEKDEHGRRDDDHDASRLDGWLGAMPVTALEATLRVGARSVSSLGGVAAVRDPSALSRRERVERAGAGGGGVRCVLVIDPGHVDRLAGSGRVPHVRPRRGTAGGCWLVSGVAGMPARATTAIVSVGYHVGSLRPSRYNSRRASMARPNVTSSAYSRSPPTGSPLASLVALTPSGLMMRER